MLFAVSTFWIFDVLTEIESNMPVCFRKEAEPAREPRLTIWQRAVVAVWPNFSKHLLSWIFRRTMALSLLQFVFSTWCTAGSRYSSHLSRSWFKSPTFLDKRGHEATSSSLVLDNKITSGCSVARLNWVPNEKTRCSSPSLELLFAASRSVMFSAIFYHSDAC